MSRVMNVLLFIMVKKSPLSLITLLALSSLSMLQARSHPTHTDGVEVYDHPEEHKKYVATLSEEDRQTLYARAGAIDWWEEARFGFEELRLAHSA